MSTEQPIIVNFRFIIWLQLWIRDQSSPRLWSSTFHTNGWLGFRSILVRQRLFCSYAVKTRDVEVKLLFVTAFSKPTFMKI